MLRSLALLCSLALASQAVLYSFTVRTSSLAGSTTSGTVYLTLIGSRGELSIGKIRNSAFRRGKIGQFSAYKPRNIGNIRSVRLSTTSRDSLLLDYITVNPEYEGEGYFYNTASTILNANPRLHSGSSSLQMWRQGGETYYVTTRTSTESRSATDKIHLKMRFIGEKGSTMTGYLDNIGRNDFKRGNDDTFVIPGMRFVGKVRCVEVEAEGRDKWKFDYFEVHCDNYRSPWLFHNNKNIWISNDSREGTSTYKFC